MGKTKRSNLIRDMLNKLIRYIKRRVMEEKITIAHIQKFIDECTDRPVYSSHELACKLEYYMRPPIKKKKWFLAQIAHESNSFRSIEEDLYYSPEGLRTIFKRHFKDNEYKKFGRRPEAIANRVYANRMGNGPEQSGDGWKYRGRGLIQVTGKNNYEAFFKWYIGKSKSSFSQNPDFLLSSDGSIVSAIWYWQSRKIDELKTFKEATKSINGGI